MSKPKEYEFVITSNGKIKVRLNQYDEEFRIKVKEWDYKLTGRRWDKNYGCWVFYNTPTVVNKLETLLDNLGYKPKEKRIKEDIIEKTKYNDGLGHLDIVAQPYSKRWGERLLQELELLKKLKSPHIVSVKFDTNNSRHVILQFKPDLDSDKIYKIELLIPLRYPNVPPKISTLGSGIHQNVAGATKYDEDFLEVVLHSCFGNLEENWHPYLGVAHYIKRFVKYISAEYYSVAVKHQ